MLQISQELKTRILKDSDFSKELSTLFNVKQSAVELWVRRNSRKLKQYEAIQFYKRNGFTEKEMFEQETEKVK